MEVIKCYSVIAEPFETTGEEWLIMLICVLGEMVYNNENNQPRRMCFFATGDQNDRQNDRNDLSEKAHRVKNYSFFMASSCSLSLVRDSL